MTQVVTALPTQSIWQATKTFFPLFLDRIETTSAQTVCVVGASDGKYVLPLARRGFRVIAIECDPLALDGGPVTLPGPTPGTMIGLRQRLTTEGLTRQVTIVEADILELTEPVESVDAVWTSCSWHYSVNHRRPLADFIAAMGNLLPGHGLFGAEYMMPVEPRHFHCEHYPEAGELRRHFIEWEILWEAYTPPFVEDPHIEQLHPHVHRMGLLIASRPDKEPSQA
jgi:SAM-dependent methyltransferase